jgi:DNA polymerase alpha subunit A
LQIGKRKREEEEEKKAKINNGISKYFTAKVAAAASKPKVCVILHTLGSL